MTNDNDEPCPWPKGHPEGEEQGALFQVEGPDEDGCVWLHAGNMTVNLGPKDAVAAIFYSWLASVET
jgi:hypothetical protein